MSSPEKKKDLICLKCNVSLAESKVHLNYLGYRFTTDLPKCPQCGQIYLSEELVKGKVAEVEMSLEDK